MIWHRLSSAASAVRKLTPLLAILALMLPGLALAQPSSGKNFVQEQQVMGNGGHTASGTSYVNRGTLGQPTPLGPAAGTDTVNDPGFWHAPSGAGDDDTSDDDTGDDDGGDDDTGSDDDIADDDTSSDDDTGGDDDDTSGRDVCDCRHAEGPPPVPAAVLTLFALAALRRSWRR